MQFLNSAFLGLFIFTMALGTTLDGYVGGYNGNECCDNTGLNPRIYASWLSWKVSGDEFEFAVEKVRTGIDGRIIDEESFHDIKFDWNDGFRLGLGVDNCCLGWGIDAIWTHFDANSSSSLKVRGFGPDPENLDNAIFVGIPVIEGGSIQLFDNLTAVFNASHHFKFDVVDIVLGKWFNLGCCNHIAFKPFAGIRIGDIQERFKDRLRILGQEVDLDLTTISSSTDEVRFSHNNKFKGAGVIAGLAIDYQICGGLSLIGRSAGSLLFGNTHLKNNLFISDIESDSYDGHIKEHYRDTRFITDLYLGFRYDTCLCGCFPVALELAWEQHYIFREHRFPVVNDYIPSNVDAASPWRKTGALSTQGLTLSAGVKF